MSLRNFGRAGAPDVARRFAIPLAAAICTSLAVYCLGSVVAGPAGLIAYRALEERKTAMTANLQALREANSRLSAELEALRSDPDRLAREARDMGYLRRDETAVILSGRTPPARYSDGGAVLPLLPPAALPDTALKEIALGAGLAVLALALAPRIKRERRRSASKGRPRGLAY